MATGTKKASSPKKKAAKKVTRRASKPEPEADSSEDQGAQGQSDQAESEKPTNGHEFNHPDILEANQKLSDLLFAFDNIGVQMVESQWRALPEEEQNIAVKWANDRRIGAGRPVPQFLVQYSSDLLKQEIAPYFDEQREIRRVIMPCVFQKSSPQKPTEDGQKISITVCVPDDSVSDSTAGTLFKKKHCRIEFTRRKCNEWDQNDLPGVEGNRPIITCVSDIPNYSWAGGSWKFSFLVDVNLLSISDAFALWMAHGSLRIEVLEQAAVSNRKEEESTPDAAENDDGEEPDEVREPTLFDPEDDEPLGLVAKPDIENPDVFNVPIKEDGFSCVIESAEVGGKFYATASFDGPDIGFGSTFEDADRVRCALTLKDALEAEVGWAIDGSSRNDVPTSVINDMKDYLKKLSDPDFIPECVRAEPDDASY